MRLSVFNVVTAVLALTLCGGSASSLAQSNPSAAPISAAPPSLEADPAGQLLVQPEDPKTQGSAKAEGKVAEVSADPVTPKGDEPSVSSFLEDSGIDLKSEEGAAADKSKKKSADVGELLDLGELGAEMNGAPVDPDKVKAQEEQTLRKEAFGAASSGIMPMKPGEIRRLLEMYDATTQAIETPIYPTPEPISSFKTISLASGTKPAVVRTAIGNVTTLSIVDITGQPWPIMDMTWAGDFQVEQPEKGSHMIRITPTTEFARGNVSMRLVGLNPPVIFSLSAERNAVDVRLDIQIPEVGPKGVLPPVDMPISTRAGDEQLTSVLLGAAGPSTGAKILGVEGVDGRTTAYDQGGLMYIRTPYTLLSPAWAKSVQSADGTKVYALNFTPVVLLSDKGKLVRAYISREEQVDDQF